MFSEFPNLRVLYRTIYGKDLAQYSSIHMYLADMFDGIKNGFVAVDTDLVKSCIYEMLFEGVGLREPWLTKFHDCAMYQAKIIWPELTVISTPAEQYLFIKEQQLGGRFVQRYLDSFQSTSELESMLKPEGSSE